MREMHGHRLQQTIHIYAISITYHNGRPQLTQSGSIVRCWWSVDRKYKSTFTFYPFHFRYPYIYTYLMYGYVPGHHHSNGCGAQIKQTPSVHANRGLSVGAVGQLFSVWVRL